MGSTTQAFHIFVANCSTQRWDIQYTLPGIAKTRKQKLEVGGQIRLSGELNIAQVEAFVKQYERYGMRHVDEIKNAKTFVGLCYQLDKPIDMERFVRHALEINQNVLELRGEQQRIEAGIATAAQIEQTSDSTLRNLEITITEDDHADGTPPKFATGVKITQDTDPHKVTRSTRRVQSGSRRAAA
jgi:hypothetical protein